MQPSTEVTMSDSILENKEVTKSYWEERMMTLTSEDVFPRPEPLSSALAAAAAEDARPEDAESRIALELREMREREEELKQLRQRISSGNLLDSMATDEGNCSEYSSEENKELCSIDGSSRVMSPEVPLQNSFGHHRTQSMDSMSSGHSSGSSAAGPQEAAISTGPSLPFRRSITVKPLDEPEDDESSYLKSNLNETPIEREMRLAAERELELKRDKGEPLCSAIPAPPKQSTPAEGAKQRAPALVNDSRDVQHRIATSRIQQEIMEATQREKELVATGTIQTLSEDTVDSKVTRFTDLAEYAMAEKAKQQVLAKTSPPAEIKSRPIRQVSTPPPSPLKNTPPLNRLRSFEASSSGQRGLMQRFLASKGQILFGNNQMANAFSVETPNFSPPTRREPLFELETDRNEVRAPPSTPIRKGFTSAEDKIQEELQDMKKREDELKLQRAHVLAQSQPNLLDLLDNEEGDEVAEEEEEEETRKDVATLSKALSNPNLLDASSYQENKKNIARKRSALIDQWESLIQKNNQ